MLAFGGVEPPPFQRIHAPPLGTTAAAGGRSGLLRRHRVPGSRLGAVEAVEPGAGELY